jgi:hypothetical protein
LDGNPVYINYEVFETVVENSLIDFKVRLGLSNDIKCGDKTSIAPGKPVEDQETREKKGTEGKKKNGDKNLIKTYSRCLEGDDFTIPGQAAKGQKDSKKHRCGNCKGKEGRGDEDKKHEEARNIPPRNNQFDQFEDFIHHEDDREGHQSNEKDRKNFLPQIEISGFFHRHFIISYTRLPV